MSNRPNYILELKDGRTIEFVPVGDESYRSKRGAWYSKDTLEDLGATPVPQEEPKVRYCHYFQAMGEVPTVPVTAMHFKSHEDAENYRLRCESIGPEWTDWEPKEGDRVWSSIPVCGLDYHCFNLGHALDRVFKDIGVIQPTKERRDEWLDRFGKAWGVM